MCKAASVPSTSSGSTRCREQCTKIYMPVCASNGRTYNNKCILEAESCKDRTAGGTGFCPKKFHVCVHAAVSSSLPTIISGTKPSLPTLGQPAIIVSAVSCLDTCTPGFRPVCGSDGVVYGSDCRLNLARCRTNNPTLVKRSDGVCTKDCSIACYKDREPVCGTNNVTYQNDCFLAVARCKDSSVGRLASGVCNTSTSRVCDKLCDDTYAPVCGSDGATYQNHCKLQAATCYYTGLIKHYDGRCKV
nr:uncharacterized protein LOC128698654 [Cherax quadricarinatus]